MLYIIGLSNCDKVQATKKWMKNKGVEFEEIDVREDPLSPDEIRDLEFKVGIDVLLNTRSTNYRESGLAEKNLSKEELVEALIENQVMIKRPVLVYQNSVLVGYDEEAFENFLKENELIEED